MCIVKDITRIMDRESRPQNKISYAIVGVQRDVPLKWIPLQRRIVVTIKNNVTVKWTLFYGKQGGVS